MKLIFDGDSWTFGCEIVDPNLQAKASSDTHPGKYDYLEENDTYRQERIYPYFMSQDLGCEYVNLSWPADDNRTIIERTMSYLSSEYITKGKSTDDIFVIIGWTSPERNSFWWKNKNLSKKFRIWPQADNFDDPMMRNVWDMYVQYLWHPEEYIPRYISTVVQFQNFCNIHNIKWLCYNAFYQTPNSNPNNWQDIEMTSELSNIDVGSYCSFENGIRGTTKLSFESLWDTVDPIRFYKKDQLNNTFKSFIEENTNDSLVGWHPSPIGHKAWADELIKYTKENKLL